MIPSKFSYVRMYQSIYSEVSIQGILRIRYMEVPSSLKLGTDDSASASRSDPVNDTTLSLAKASNGRGRASIGSRECKVGWWTWVQRCPEVLI